MLKDYRALAIFAAVAEAGSFSQAGRRLKLSTSVVSHHIANLEERLGVSLFFRTSRTLSLTSEGQTILDSARRMVAAGEEALDALTAHTDQPVGSLRITMPAFGNKTHMRQSIWSFAKKYPMISVTLNTSDRQVDLVKERFDVAIRLGELGDSSLKCRRITDFTRLLVASPRYLETRASIRTVDDLKECDFVGMSILPSTISLQNDNEQVSFEPDKVRLEVDNIGATKSAVMAGFGIQRLPLGEIMEELETGELVRILPQWSLPVLGIYAVWPDTGPQKQLTRRFIQHLTEMEELRLGKAPV